MVVHQNFLHWFLLQNEAMFKLIKQLVDLLNLLRLIGIKQLKYLKILQNSYIRLMYIKDVFRLFELNHKAPDLVEFNLDVAVILGTKELDCQLLT